MKTKGRQQTHKPTAPSGRWRHIAETAAIVVMTLYVVAGAGISRPMRDGPELMRQKLATRELTKTKTVLTEAILCLIGFGLVTQSLCHKHLTSLGSNGRILGEFTKYRIKHENFLGN
ncbi:hypothetical protein PoB_000308900 [Plakobranchus ocellatus]|uniref:Membrane magnesium transporter n=1 Tax=Plakobranchus ocellatus TaxID=259542 RepID=A0AAV3Y3C9_9GAST|nr:hypothetical protein PoB_000308900 [Plakobranchus ocellatus]